MYFVVRIMTSLTVHSQLVPWLVHGLRLSVEQVFSPVREGTFLDRSPHDSTVL